MPKKIGKQNKLSPVQCSGLQPPESRTVEKRVYCGRCGKLLGKYPPETQMVTAIICSCYKKEDGELQKI